MQAARGGNRDLLAEAADCGFSHFDTAPSYGFGIAERDLAPVLKAHRGLTVTSKAGLFAPGGEDGSAGAVLLRKALGKLAPSLSKAQVDFSLARAKISLDASLRRLGRERLDLFLLHAPRIDLVATDEWLGWLTSLAEQGRIGAFGLAVTRVDDALDFLDRAPALAPVIQCPDSLGAREADALVARGRAPQLTYGYIAAARRRAPRSDVPEILKQALRRNPFGALVVSTLRRERLRLFAEAAPTRSPTKRPIPTNRPSGGLNDPKSCLR